jgi:16S rRNA (cytidine1402-2'-O)-methyltransferase
VARELTKLHEEVRRGTLPELAAAYAAEGAPRGELVIVVAPPAERPAEADDALVDQLLRAELRERKPRAAAAEVASATGRSANELYRRALALGREDS